MMNPYIVVVVICVGITLSTIVRMRRAASVPSLFWFVLLLSLANPLFVGWIVNFPEKEEKTVTLEKESEEARLFIPENYSLMVTAIRSSEELDPSDEKSFKTNYAIKIEGMHNKKIWLQSETGAMERKSESDERVKLKKIEGEKLSAKSGEGRTVGFQENMQDRFALRHTGGDVLISLKNYEGKAINGLTLQAVQSPPSNAVLWGIALLFSVLGVYFESNKRCDKVAGDIGFLVFYGLFLSQETAPLDGIKGMLYPGVPALFMGYAPVAGAAYLANKFYGKG